MRCHLIIGRRPDLPIFRAATPTSDGKDDATAPYTCLEPRVLRLVHGKITPFNKSRRAKGRALRDGRFSTRYFDDVTRHRTAAAFVYF